MDDTIRKAVASVVVVKGLRYAILECGHRYRIGQTHGTHLRCRSCEMKTGRTAHSTELQYRRYLGGPRVRIDDGREGTP